MKSIKFQYSPYEFDFVQPFATSRSVYNSRKGFIIVLTDEEGRKGFGEAAPLEELGSEKFEEAREQLSTLKFNLALDFSDLINSIEQNLKQFNKFPAVKHGIEQALLKLICVQKNLSINELLNQVSRPEIPVNAAVGLLSPIGTVKKVNELIALGYKTIKLKGGREKFSEDLDRVRVLHKEFGNEVKFRLDINGKWSLNDAISNLKRLEQYNLEYAEQPVSSIDEMAELAGKTSVPIAPDESIRNYEDAVNFIEKKISRFIILKPMMTGGLLTVLRIIALAEKNNVYPVITTSLETAIGRAFAVFAASTVKHNYAHGLATGMYLKNDITEDPYPVKDGKIKLKG